MSRVPPTLENNISALPNCAADASVLGIVSERDLVRLHVAGNVERRARRLIMLAESSHPAPGCVDYARLDRQNVADLMTTALISGDEPTSVAEFAVLMAQNRIKRVPILRDAKLVGIVSRVIGAIGRSPDAIVAAE